jgi:hypothetical protein
MVSGGGESPFDSHSMTVVDGPRATGSIASKLLASSRRMQ